MKRVALITYSTSPNLTPSDSLLVEPLQKQGFEVSAVAWDDPTVRWNQFDTIVLRSCWNYHLKLEKFHAWLDTLKKEINVTVWNPIDVVHWNSKKTYLRDLEKKGIPTIPTVWIDRDSDIQKSLGKMQWEMFVIKPSVGAGGFKVASFGRKNLRKAGRAIEQLKKDGTVLVQPFMEEIWKGELSIVFLGGRYSHTILKPRDKKFKPDPEFKTQKLIQLNDNLLSQAKEIYRLLNLQVLYARIDVLVVKDSLILMELELIEPHLFFDLYPTGAQMFAEAFAKRHI